MAADATGPIDLWTCLHDGAIEALRSDLLARTLTFVIDSPFHIEFHKLPTDTRIQVVAQGVRSVARFDHESWPGAIDLPTDTPWSEVQKQQQRNWQQGRLISADWNSFAQQIGTSEEFIVFQAELRKEQSLQVLSIGMQRYPTSQWNDVELRAEHVRFFIGDRELSIEELVVFGDAYWNDFSRRGQMTPGSSEDTEVE